MRLKQIIISVLLLFVYSFGFAHSMMSHEHGFHSEHQPESHNHEHHEHSNHVEENTTHINHNNHCDEGVFDLILCFFNDFQHHNHDCEDENLNYENSKRLTNTNFNNSDVNFVSSFITYSKTVNTITLHSKSIDFEFCNSYKEYALDCSPLRGPPSLFI